MRYATHARPIHVKTAVNVYQVAEPVVVVRTVVLVTAVAVHLAHTEVETVVLCQAHMEVARLARTAAVAEEAVVHQQDHIAEEAVVRSHIAALSQ